MYSVFLYSVFLIIFIFVIASIFILADDCEANKQNKQSLKGKQNFLVPDYYNRIKRNEYKKIVFEKKNKLSADYLEYIKDNKASDTLENYKLFLKERI